MNLVLHGFLAAGVPALLAGILWLAGCFPPLQRFRWLFSALAVGAGYLLAHLWILGRPPFPPVDAQQWLFYFALVGIALGWLTDRLDSRWLQGAILLMVLGGLMVVGLKSLIQSGYWSLAGGTGAIVGLTLAVWLLIVLVIPLGKREQGASLPFLLAGLGGLSAGVLFYSKSASLAQLAGSLGAVIGIGVPIGWFWREFRLGRGAVSLYLMMLAFLWVFTLGYAELRLPHLAMLFLGGLSLALGELPALRRQPSALRFVIRFLVLLVLVGIPFELTYQAYMAASGTPYSY